ncbi:putative membrane protein [Ancylomarina subtilis]|uniref:Putative membrane protein n=1 Tax=Ancylomarina subtilis TaxID=1639035 RepID=A0A4V2FRW0_9BACT|nr:YibE/F family protein [Ancylomarina subtilis]RZT91859.1 putative membrane protein [Ancylomarina subtilis]
MIKVPKKSDLILVGLLIIACFSLIVFPNEFSKDQEANTQRVKALVLSTNNELMVETGILKTGTQKLQIRILDGKFKNVEIQAFNQLIGRMEFDKLFIPGDKTLTVLNLNQDHSTIKSANVIDHYRINMELWLLILFVILLVSFAGWVGLKAILSFMFAGLTIWKLLLPGFLKGFAPIPLSLGIVALLTSVIIFLVAGTNKKGLVAFLGAMSGIIVTCMMAIIFGAEFNIHGAIKPFSETLLYSGYAHLNLTDIFLAGIFISSSGAVMDISMDIAASQAEIINHNPAISTKKLRQSGFEVGKVVVGTMTTTLLLAYSGGFSALLMVFIAQGTPMTNILNLNYVSGELLHTLVGSFGLVLVAPFTAIIGSWVFTRQKVSKISN